MHPKNPPFGFTKRGGKKILRLLLIVRALRGFRVRHTAPHSAARTHRPQDPSWDPHRPESGITATRHSGQGDWGGARGAANWRCIRLRREWGTRRQRTRRTAQVRPSAAAPGGWAPAERAGEGVREGPVLITRAWSRWERTPAAALHCLLGSPGRPPAARYGRQLRTGACEAR